MSEKIKICCITGTRADYPRVKSVLKEIKENGKFDLQIIVTGSHLLESHGNSYTEILDDGFLIDKKVEMYIDDFNSPLGMTLATSRCMKGVAEALDDLNPDICLITVDRVETLAAASAASLMNFPIAHIQGGEVTGTIDESIRHAVSKLSHIHFPATEDAYQRILFMGEPKENIFLTGCPYIDIISSFVPTKRKELTKKYSIKFDKPVAIFTQHPVTTEFGKSKDQIIKTVKALEKFEDKINIINFYSNPDAGGDEITKYLSKTKFVNIPNMDSKDFLSLMNFSSFMIGNSSAGIREAPSFKLPVINIGTRQNGRLRGENVIDVEHDTKKIEDAINFIIQNEDFKNKIKAIKNPYGDGNAAKKIVEVLENLVIDENLIKKVFIDNHEI
tara:strand:+ start:3799 stop:4962 length:1164 start_codon:yes stop_codon:yes gene_type:complete